MDEALPLKPETITLIELRHGYRIDIIAVHTASGEARKQEPEHYPNLAIARKRAAMLEMLTGYPIEERLRKTGA